MRDCQSLLMTLKGLNIGKTLCRVFIMPNINVAQKTLVNRNYLCLLKYVLINFFIT